MTRFTLFGHYRKQTNEMLIGLYTHTCACTHTCMHVCKYVFFKNGNCYGVDGGKSMCVWVCVCVSVWVCMCACMCECVSVFEKYSHPFVVEHFSFQRAINDMDEKHLWCAFSYRSWNITVTKLFTLVLLAKGIVSLNNNFNTLILICTCTHKHNLSNQYDDEKLKSTKKP